MKTTDTPIKIIIVDDHRLFNDGLDAMLSAQENIDVQAQIYDSREAEQKILALKPDVVLIDFNMPFMNGIELTKLLLSKIPDIKILILSMYNEEMYIENFKRSGSKGYLFKTASVEEVVKAIGDVNAGLQHFPNTTKKSTHSEDMFLKRLKLSDREVEVIRLVKAGLKTKEIADKLNISFYTAETHRKNIKLKIGIEGEAAFLKFIYSNDFEGGQSIKTG